MQCIKCKLLYYSKYLGTLGSLKVGGVKTVGVEGWSLGEVGKFSEI